MKLFERVIEQHIRIAVNIIEIQFGFMPGKGTMEAIFIIRQLQEKYLAKERTLYFIFVGLKKTMAVSQGLLSGGRSGRFASLSGSLRPLWLCKASARVRLV